MTACERLSDRIPDVARGRERWTAEESAHLTACADCRAEWDLVTAAIRVGAAAPSPRDPSAMTDAVLWRLAEARRSRRSRRSWGLGIAAAAAVLGVIWAGRQSQENTRQPAQVEIALPELEPLETAELDSLLETMDAPQVGTSALDEPSLDDLDAHELEQVLGTLEG